MGGGGEGCKSVLDTEGNCPQFGGSRSWIWLPGERNHMYSLYDVQCIQMNMYSLYNVRCIQMNMHSQYTDENVHQDLGSSSHGEKPPGIECSAVKPKGERVRGLPHLVLNLLQLAYGAMGIS